MLTYNEFEILVYLEKNRNKKITQRDISQDINFSLGNVNKIVNILIEKGFVSNYPYLNISEKGIDMLENYRVKRAIFLAAGFGSRLVPITLNTPKPLVLVHGKRMIETLLEAVIAAEIEEIIIVTGYLSEQFEVLKHTYPNIKFIYNPLYNEANNISSAYMVKDYFENAYVLESDLVLSNKSLIRKYEYRSNFLGISVDSTDDWCFEIKNGIITKQKIGGTECYQMIGISYYNKEDGQKLKEDIEMVFNQPGGKEKYWDQVPLDVKKQNYKIYVRECNKNDIIEIDTYNELKTIDKSYV